MPLLQRRASVPPSPAWTLLLCLAAFFAVVPSALLAVNVPPSATFLNQAAAISGWGAFATVLLLWQGRALPTLCWRGGLGALLAAVALLIAACAMSVVRHGLPASLALSAIGLLAAAGLLACVGAASAASGGAALAFRALCLALMAAGVLSVAVGAVQVFAPTWADGQWIASTSLEGRAAGNLRQPNHLSSLLLWSLVAALWWIEATDASVRARAQLWRVLLCALMYALMLAFVFGLVLSASRTGMLGVLVLAAWGALDRTLSRRARVLLCVSPLVYALCWFGVTLWADATGHVFGGAARLRREADISSSRFDIWANTWTLIAHQPWFGVGWGEFNLAWSLTPFPDRPVAFFDHTHNLLLQWAVELGLPLALAVTALMGWALWRAWLAGCAEALPAAPADRERMRLLRAAWMMVLLVAWHSLLEYPLWYAYFLLPAAFAWGLCLGAPAGGSGTSTAAAAATDRAPQRPRSRASAGRAMLAASLLMTAAGLAAVLDYLPVVAIFEPAEGAPPLAERIEHGRRSWLFAHHADYAAATTGDSPPEVLRAMKGAQHFLLDTRLMIAWADALAAAGDMERARHIAARLREFRNPAAKDFFAPCDHAPSPAAALAYPCAMPSRPMDHRDFR